MIFTCQGRGQPSAPENTVCVLRVLWPKALCLVDKCGPSSQSAPSLHPQGRGRLRFRKLVSGLGARALGSRGTRCGARALCGTRNPTGQSEWWWFFVPSSSECCRGAPHREQTLTHPLPTPTTPPRAMLLRGRLIAVEERPVALRAWNCTAARTRRVRKGQS